MWHNQSSVIWSIQVGNGWKAILIVFNHIHLSFKLLIYDNQVKTPFTRFMLPFNTVQLKVTVESKFEWLANQWFFSFFEIEKKCSSLSRKIIWKQSPAAALHALNTAGASEFCLCSVSIYFSATGLSLKESVEVLRLAANKQQPNPVDMLQMFQVNIFSWCDIFRKVYWTVYLVSVLWYRCMFIFMYNKKIDVVQPLEHIGQWFLLFLPHAHSRNGPFTPCPLAYGFRTSCQV